MRGREELSAGEDEKVAGFKSFGKGGEPGASY